MGRVRWSRSSNKRLMSKVGPELLNRFKPMKLDLAAERRRQLNKKNYPSEVWFIKLLQMNSIAIPKRNVCVAGRFFGDFIWRTLGIVVEIDGPSHDATAERDSLRDEFMRRIGITVYRIPWNDLGRAAEVIQILKNIISIKWAKKQIGEQEQGLPRTSSRHSNKRLRAEDLTENLRLYCESKNIPFKRFKAKCIHLQIGETFYWPSTGRVHEPRANLLHRKPDEFFKKIGFSPCVQNQRPVA